MAMTDAEQAGIKVEVIPDYQDPDVAVDVVGSMLSGVPSKEPVVPTLRGKPVEQYDLNLDEFYRVTADRLSEEGKRNDLPAVTNELVKSLIAKAKTDPQFEGINWNKFSQQDPNRS